MTILKQRKREIWFGTVYFLVHFGGVKIKGGTLCGFCFLSMRHALLFSHLVREVIS